MLVKPNGTDKEHDDIELKTVSHGSLNTWRSAILSDKTMYTNKTLLNQQNTAKAETRVTILLAAILDPVTAGVLPTHPWSISLDGAWTTEVPIDTDYNTFAYIAVLFDCINM